MARVSIEVTINTVKCCECGIVFGLEADYQARLRSNGQTFYCPNGHSQRYGESEADRLKGELAKQAKAREQLEMQLRWKSEDAERAERRRAAAVGQITKMKNRIANGVCPICNRSFTALHRHMQTKHPDFCKEEAADGR